MFSVREYFGSSEKQRLPLAGSGDSVPWDIIDISHAPLVELALDEVEASRPLYFGDPISDIHTISTSSQGERSEVMSPPTAPLERVDAAQRPSSLSMWEHIRYHLRNTHFALHEPGWPRKRSLLLVMYS